MPDNVAAAIVAEEAAEVAELAADVAAVAASEPAPPSGDTLVHAEVELARMEHEEDLARIEARTEVKLAEINQEEPAWLGEIQACLARIEAKLETMPMAAPLTPAPSVETVVITEPTAPVVDQPVVAAEPSESGDGMPVSPEAVSQEPAAPAARKRSRWI